MPDPNTLRALAGLPLDPGQPGRIGARPDRLPEHLHPWRRWNSRGCRPALDEAAALLERARVGRYPVIHIQHDDGPGSLYDIGGESGAIVDRVAPRDGEPVVVKNYPNSFVQTDLDERLKAVGASNLVLAGFMTHMCVNSTARGAFNLGYAPTVVAGGDRHPGAARPRRRSGAGGGDAGREPGRDGRPVRRRGCPTGRHSRLTCGHMRMSAKAEYAVRAMVQLATVDDGTIVKTDDLARAQGIPPQFLVDILTDLRNDRLVRSHRGRDGGYELARPAADISIADVLRCIDGPLASVRDIGLGDLPYSGPTESLTDVWRALRASMRSVLEQTTLADVASGALPEHVRMLADDYRSQESARGHSVG